MAAMRRFTNLIPSSLKLFQTSSGSCFRKYAIVSVRNASRPFTRSLWCATKDPVIFSNKTNRCGCCGIHTEGDGELAEFLKEEINMEKKHKASKLPTLDGFELEKSNDCNISFIKTGTTERFRVSFNVNNAIEDESEMVDESEEAVPSKIRCKPPFVVEIEKGYNKTLHIQCQFPNASELAEAGVEETEGDMIEITDVAILNSGEEWNEDAYSLQGGVMDGNLYDMLLHMMEERGLDTKVVSQLVDFSTAYEHQQYVKFLKDLQNFASSNE